MTIVRAELHWLLQNLWSLGFAERLRGLIREAPFDTNAVVITGRRRDTDSLAQCFI